MTAPLVLLDAAGLYFRAYYAVPESTTAPDGTPVNAVRGFLDAVSRIITERKPARLVACLDADWRPQFRVDLLPSYKTHRVADEVVNAEEVPDTLSPQVPIIIEILEAFGISTAYAEGYEADDVIGALTEQEKIAPVEIVTGDRDLFQLVRDVPTPASIVYVGAGWAKAQVLGPKEVAEKYGLSEENAGSAYADLAILRGDPSDGLPGVAGIGEKTAAKLISQFGSLTGLLEESTKETSVLPAKMREKLLAAADYLAVAPRVVRVATDLSVTFSADDHVPNTPTDPVRLQKLATQWGLSNPIDRLLSVLNR